MTSGPAGIGRIRRRYALAAAGALAVTIVFATIGDGVEVPGATGPARVVVDVGHIAVWGLLTAAFVVAAARGRWTRPANALAVVAGIGYAVFLLAVLFG